MDFSSTMKKLSAMAGTQRFPEVKNIEDRGSSFRDLCRGIYRIVDHIIDYLSYDMDDDVRVSYIPSFRGIINSVKKLKMISGCDVDITDVSKSDSMILIPANKPKPKTKSVIWDAIHSQMDNITDEQDTLDKKVVKVMFHKYIKDNVKPVVQCLKDTPETVIELNSLYGELVDFSRGIEESESVKEVKPDTSGKPIFDRKLRECEEKYISAVSRVDGYMGDLADTKGINTNKLLKIMDRVFDEINSASKYYANKKTANTLGVMRQTIKTVISDFPGFRSGSEDEILKIIGKIISLTDEMNDLFKDKSTSQVD